MAIAPKLTIKLKGFTRWLVVSVIALVIAHALAAWGVKAGMPEWPNGDEALWQKRWFYETVKLVWVVWEPVWEPVAEPTQYYTYDSTHRALQWWVFKAARLAWVLIVLWLLGELLMRYVRNPYRRWRAVRRGGHDIVVGVSPVALRLVQAWAARKRAVVVVSPGGSVSEAASQRGAACVDGAWGEDRVMQKCGLIKAGTLTAIAGEDLENIDVAARAARVVGRDRPADTAPLQVLTQVNDPFLRARIDERIDRFGRMDALQFIQILFDPCGTGCACHAFDGQLDLPESK